MTMKNEGRFASLKALRHQRLGEEDDVAAESDMSKEAALAKPETTEKPPKTKPAPEAKRSGGTNVKRNNGPKAVKFTAPKQQTQEPKQAGPGRPRGRRSNPDYTQITAYVPLALYLDIQEELTREKRELQKRSAMNASELIEELLSEWLSSRKSKNAKY